MGLTGEITEEQRSQLFIVKDSANHLLGLIEDVLDISRIEAGKVELSLTEFRLDEVISEVVEIISPAINEKRLKLIREVPEGITLFSDKRRIKQVMINLTNNAVKFTNKGNVKIATKILKDKMLEMRITDTGIGIKPEDMNKLFLPFQQIESLPRQDAQGNRPGIVPLQEAGHSSWRRYLGKERIWQRKRV